MDNTQLPADVVLQIQVVAKAYANKTFWGRNFITPHAIRYKYYTDIATEYAIKLHQAQQENKELKDQIEDYVLNGRDKDFKGRTLLEKVISRHEAGLLPDRFIYNEIKNFLDGTK